VLLQSENMQRRGLVSYCEREPDVGYTTFSGATVMIWTDNGMAQAYEGASEDEVQEFVSKHVHEMNTPKIHRMVRIRDSSVRWFCLNQGRALAQIHCLRNKAGICMNLGQSDEQLADAVVNMFFEKLPESPLDLLFEYANTRIHALSKTLKMESAMSTCELYGNDFDFFLNVPTIRSMIVREFRHVIKDTDTNIHSDIHVQTLEYNTLQTREMCEHPPNVQPIYITVEHGGQRYSVCYCEFIFDPDSGVKCVRLSIRDCIVKKLPMQKIEAFVDFLVSGSDVNCFYPYMQHFSHGYPYSKQQLMKSIGTAVRGDGFRGLFCCSSEENSFRNTYVAWSAEDKKDVFAPYIARVFSSGSIIQLVSSAETGVRSGGRVFNCTELFETDKIDNFLFSDTANKAMLVLKVLKESDRLEVSVEEICFHSVQHEIFKCLIEGYAKNGISAEMTKSVNYILKFFLNPNTLPLDFVCDCNPAEIQRVCSVDAVLDSDTINECLRLFYKDFKLIRANDDSLYPEQDPFALADQTVLVDPAAYRTKIQKHQAAMRAPFSKIDLSRYLAQRMDWNSTLYCAILGNTSSIQILQCYGRYSFSGVPCLLRRISVVFVDEGRG